MATTGKPASPTKKAAAKKASASSASSSSKNQPYQFTDADKLKQKWRSLVSSVVVANRAAEKAAGRPDSKELDDAVMTTLRSRNDFRRYAAIIEASLLGQAKENEALEALFRSTPCLGSTTTRSDNSNNNPAAPS